MCDSHSNQGARYSGISPINQIFSNIFVSTFFNIQIFDEARKFSFGSPLRAAIAYGGEIWIRKTFFQIFVLLRCRHRLPVAANIGGLQSAGGHTGEVGLPHS